MAPPKPATDSKNEPVLEPKVEPKKFAMNSMEVNLGHAEIFIISASH